MPVRWLGLPLALALVALGACGFDPAGASRGGGGANAAPGPGEPDAEPGEQPVEAPASCAEILAGGNATSGIYEMNPGGAGHFSAYCEMEVAGGGWTLALKADGERSTFGYSSILWTTGELLAPEKADLDREEAKLESFNRMPFSQVMVRFETRVGKEENTHLQGFWLWMSIKGDSLLDLFAAGEYVPVNVRRDLWLEAIPNSSLQDDCQRAGINTGVEWNQVRLGIVADGDDDCESPDSKLGVGNSFACANCKSCEDGPGLAGPAVGNNDSGCSTVVSFASIFVR
jgi:hypothetical protein